MSEENNNLRSSGVAPHEDEAQPQRSPEPVRDAAEDNEEAPLFNKQSIRVTRSDPLASTSERSHSIRSNSGNRHSTQSHKLNHHSKERRARWIRDKMNNYNHQPLSHSGEKHNGLGPSPYNHPLHPVNRCYYGDSGKIINRPYPPNRLRSKRPLTSYDSSGLNHTMNNWDDSCASGTNSNWMSESDSKAAKFHRPYSVREQRSWAQPSTSSPLYSVDEEGGSKQRLRAGRSLPVPADGRYLEFKQGNLQRYSGSHHHHPSDVAGLRFVGDEIDVADQNNFDQDEEDDEDQESEEDHKIGRLSSTSYHFTRQTRPPYPYRLKSHHNNLSGGERSLEGVVDVEAGITVRSRSQSPCSITSESAESQGEKALDPPTLALPNDDGVGGLSSAGINGAGRERKLSVLFASYDAWNEENIIHSFKEMTPMATSVFEAAWTGNLELLEELLCEDDNQEHKDNLKKLREGEFRDSEGRSPLHLASACGHVPCVELLLKKGAEVNSYDGNENNATALSCAASCGSSQVVKVLLEHGADPNAGYDQGKTALFWAVQAGSVECAKLLLEAGAKQNPPQVYSETPLHVAAALGDSAMISVLLDNKADVNLCKGTTRSTALHLAAEEGSAACVRLLLKAGANHAAKDIRGHTALHIAITCDADTASVLLKAGADPNAIDANGRTPLHCSVARGSRAAECVRLLVENGADIDAQDNYGYTALHLSAVNESSQCAKILLHHGSDVTLKTNAGTNALSLLVRKIPDVMRYLVERLDQAVTIHDHDSADPDCEIRLDFRAIVPNCEKRVSNGKTGNGHVKNKAGGVEVTNGGGGGDKKRDYFQKPHKETEFLTCLVAAGNKKILAHPLSEAFLTLKWARVRKFFFASLLFQIALVALFTIYVVQVFLIECPYKRVHDLKKMESSPEPYIQGALQSPPGPPLDPYLNKTGNLSSTNSSKPEGDPNGAKHNISRRSANPDPSDGFGGFWTSFIPPKRNRSRSYNRHNDIQSRMSLQSPPLTSESTPSSSRGRSRYPFPVILYPNGTITALPGPLSINASKEDEAECQESEVKIIPTPCTLNTTLKTIWIMLVSFTSLLAIKEIFQLLQSPLSYVVSSENWGQWLLISSVTMTAWGSPEHSVEYWQYPAAAVGVFLAWGLMLLQVGRFPALGLYVQMLGKVAANFGLFILAYACLLIAFALAFCVLFHEHPPYATAILSVLKVFTMMVGEVDYEDLFYNDERADDPLLFHVTGHLLYGAFVVFVTIVLMNLLVGLAVHDIQGLQKGAKLNRLSRQTALISRLESFIFSKKLGQVLPKSLGSILQKSALLVPSSYNWSFYFRPNDPRDKRLPKDIKQASLRLAAARHSAGKSKSHQLHLRHSQNYHQVTGPEHLILASGTPRPLSTVSRNNQASALHHHPEVTIRRIEQRLDVLQHQLDKVLGNLNGRMEAVLDVLLEQKPDLQMVLPRGQSEMDTENSFMDDGIYLAKSVPVSPSASVYRKPSFKTSPTILNDVSCEKG